MLLSICLTCRHKNPKLKDPCIVALQVMHLQQLAKQHRVRHLTTCAFYAWLEQVLEQADVNNVWQQEDDAPQQQRSQAIPTAKYGFYATVMACVAVAILCTSCCNMSKACPFVTAAQSMILPCSKFPVVVTLQCL